MSLHALAGHMASKGRGSDSMLVHMTPEEVQSLQVLALKGGGTLTINPDTGLPEANFLKKMLPMIAGFALGPAGFGLMSAGMAGAAVGGITALSTGSLSRGLMAGLGAYGGASLGGSLAGAGEGAIAAGDIAAQQAAGTFPTLAEGASQEAIAKYASDVGGLRDAALSKAGEAGFGAKMSAGFGQMASNPGAYTREMLTGLATISPVLADEGVKTTTKRPDTGTIRNFTFDPYGQTYTSAGNYPASEYKGMAQGGIVALAAGGPSNVAELYQQVAGREADPGGLQYWQQQFGDTIDPNEINTFKSAIGEARTQGTEPVAPAGFTPFTGSQINQYIQDNNLDAAGIAAATKQFNVDPNAVINAQNARGQIQDVYRNVLGRDVDPSGLQYWTDRIVQGGISGQDMYNEFLHGARTAGETIRNPNLTLDEALRDYSGFTSSDQTNIADEWVRNTLGREVTDTDRQQQWYKDATNAAAMNTYDAAQNIFGQFKDYAAKTGQSPNDALANARAVLASKNLTEADVLAQTGKSLSELVRGPNLDLGLFQASQLNAPESRFDFSSLQAKAKAPSITSVVDLPGGVSGGGNTVVNPNGTITTAPNIPGRPEGGFTGMRQLRDIYTQGGGSLGYVNPAPKTMEEFNQRFNKQTGDSLAAYNYLMGQGANPIKSGVGEIMRPYSEAVRGIPAAEGRPTQKYIYQNGKYVENPNYRPVSYNSKGERMVGPTSNEVIQGVRGIKDPAALFDFVTDNRISEAQLAAALNIPIAEARARIAAGKKSKDATRVVVPEDAAQAANGGVMRMALGGLGALAGGGSTSQYNLGGYSDGGRLLRGPGDGVSDSIPATIGGKQPARLADGEFVVPARIVSELGNGSTEAGARKLYAMMDRVQKARGKTTGKNRVAANTRSEKYLPA